MRGGFLRPAITPVAFPYNLGLTVLATVSLIFPSVCSGPVSSLLVNRYGCRTVVMVGGLMSGLSVAGASLANSIIYLYFFVGIIGGTGFDFRCLHSE